MSSLGGETTSCSKCGSALGPHDLDCPRCGEPRVDDRTLMRREAVTPAPEVLNGKWKMERELGHGGMGSVHLATDLQLDRQVAIKTLAANLSANEEVRTRFEREAKMMAKLDHPNLVPIYEVGRKGELPYIVMKFLEGETLGDALKRRGPLPVEEVGAIVKQVCAGLAFVHGKGFVHRDIKPANIFLSPDGHVTILDLGVAHDTSSHHTKTGMVIGTPRYMSPEQILGRKVDLRSDLYAVGTVLFELLTGSPVFGGDSDFSVMKSHAEVEPPDPSELSAAVSPSVSAVVRRALAKDPAARFQSAQELSAAFLAAVQGTLAPAYETPARQPAAPTRPALAPPRTVAPRAPARPADTVPQEFATAPSTAMAVASVRSGVRAPVVIGGALAVLAAGILVAVAWPHADPTPAVVEIPTPPPVPGPSVAPPTPPAPADPPPVKPGPTAETVAAHDPPATPTPPVKPQGTGKVVPQVKPVANTGPATVVVTATHEGKLSWAWLDVDGMRQGATPKRLTLEPGPHTLQLSRDGFRTVTRSVSVAAGEDKKLSVPMEAQ